MAKKSSTFVLPLLLRSRPQRHTAYTAFQRVPPWLKIHFAHYSTALMRLISQHLCRII